MKHPRHLLELVNRLRKKIPHVEAVEIRIGKYNNYKIPGKYYYWKLIKQLKLKLKTAELILQDRK